MSSHFELRSSVKPWFAVKLGDFRLPKGRYGRHQLAAQAHCKTSMENTILFHIILSVTAFHFKIGEVVSMGYWCFPHGKTKS